MPKEKKTNELNEDELNTVAGGLGPATKPGQSFKVNIRGIGTFNSSSSLFVLDEGAKVNIDDLKSDDIELVDVLKD